MELKIRSTVYNFIILALFTVGAAQNVYAQGSPDRQQVISRIKQVFQQINSDKNYKVITIDDSEDFLGHATDNGGSLKGYFKGDSLKKIVEWVGLSNRVIQNEYYFDGENLVFVYATDRYYKFNDSTGEMDFSGFGKQSYGRYYFTGDRLINSIVSDKKRLQSKNKDAAAFLTSCKYYKKLLKARRTR